MLSNKEGTTKTSLLAMIHTQGDALLVDRPIHEPTFEHMFQSMKALFECLRE